uniref:Uncharacterized protein n=1 Tax=Utricularia reniformis TaxID=192314 RepID=A0A1Y0B0Y4_9LAMI|nr:hypothetical protein AEK19_MT0896 [Utricularia reniformis]ART31126.1 hypothetical protein AEK19_MT0896 [Utricularia reniformis]
MNHYFHFINFVDPERLVKRVKKLHSIFYCSGRKVEQIVQ